MHTLTDVVRELQRKRAETAKEVKCMDAALAVLNGSKGAGLKHTERLLAIARTRIAAVQRTR